MVARYICIEGTEGVGKTTQTDRLVDFLKTSGYRVLKTKEPGTPLSPLTMELRNIMLNAKYDGELTRTARELVSQAIRSIHLENVISPAIEEYDFIVQDRGILSGISYGESCGNDISLLENLMYEVCINAKLGSDWTDLYDDVVYLTGDTSVGLSRALAAKQEFEAGDSIEKKGNSFMLDVSTNMNKYAPWFGAKMIAVTGKSIDQVFEEILNSLSLGGNDG
jgi:dTMP kinase